MGTIGIIGAMEVEVQELKEQMQAEFSNGLAVP